MGNVENPNKDVIHHVLMTKSKALRTKNINVSESTGSFSLSFY